MAHAPAVNTNGCGCHHPGRTGTHSEVLWSRGSPSPFLPLHQDLIADLKYELTGKFERLIVSLMRPPAYGDAKEIKDAISVRGGHAPQGPSEASPASPMAHGAASLPTGHRHG